jgi:hypothetical protein
MEILNGRIKKVCVCFSGRGKKQTVDMGSSNSYRGAWYYWLIPLCFLSLAGCETMKSSLITGLATSTAVGVTSVVAPGVLVPAVIGGTTAVIASAMTAERSVKGDPISVTADTVVNKAPDNFWTLLGKLISIGGWVLILIVLVPMVFSWLMPGPIQFKGKKKNGS